MAQLKNHAGFWLRDDAAAAFDRAEADHGIFIVNSAARTPAQQNELIRRWDRGGAANRPPYLYQPARPAEASNHVSKGGIAIDLRDWRRFAIVAAAYGFTHPYPGGDPVHFEYVGSAAEKYPFSQVTLDRQNFLNSRGWNLVPDGREGPLTIQAVKEYQEFLRDNYGYTGEIDGLWRGQTQGSHQKFYDALHRPAPQPAGAATYNPFGIPSAKGLQKIARLNGYKGGIDDKWGTGSAAGFAKFLRNGYGYRGNDVLGPVMWAAIARWLRARWGYVGNDVPGPVMRAALVRANNANEREL